MAALGGTLGCIVVGLVWLYWGFVFRGLRLGARVGIGEKRRNKGTLIKVFVIIILIFVKIASLEWV